MSNSRTNEKKLEGSVRKPECCPYCKGKTLVRRGIRSKKHENIQIYFCKKCKKRITGQTLNGKAYPTPMILEALSLYSLGFSLSEVAAKLEALFGISVAKATVHDWTTEFKGLCPFSRMREEALKIYKPHQMIEKVRLKHQQTYDFMLHRGKLDLLLKHEQNTKFQSLKDLLTSVASDCPHDLFREGGRASKVGAVFSRDELWVEQKDNFAVDTTKFVIQSIAKNTLRHQAIQKFMLLNDSVTVATEVPIIMDQRDLNELRKLGFVIPESVEGPVTGHIDILQIRNGAIHILDYKPGSKSVDAVDQLTIYALALSRLTGLRLFDFSCGWFDETGYYDFWPLHVVHKTRSTKSYGRKNNDERPTGIQGERPRAQARAKRSRNSEDWDGWEW